MYLCTCLYTYVYQCIHETLTAYHFMIDARPVAPRPRVARRWSANAVPLHLTISLLMQYSYAHVHASVCI